MDDARESLLHFQVKSKLDFAGFRKWHILAAARRECGAELQPAAPPIFNRKTFKGIKRRDFRSSQNSILRHGRLKIRASHGLRQRHLF
jgi:hypothetical protein